MPVMALQGDAGETRHAFENRQGAWKMRICVGIDAAKVTHWALTRAGQGVSGGERKSDPRDARSIADRVRTRDLRPILPDDDARVALRRKVGRRRKLIQDQTRRISRLRGLLCGTHPGLERTPDLACKGPLALRARHVTPSEIRRAGKSRLPAPLRKTPQLHGNGALADRAPKAARAQKVVVPGEASAAEPIRDRATEALGAGASIVQLERDLEGLLAHHPDGALVARARRRVTVIRTMRQRREALESVRKTACLAHYAALFCLRSSIRAYQRISR